MFFAACIDNILKGIIKTDCMIFLIVKFWHGIKIFDLQRNLTS